jgi:antitoxin PrlF
VSIPTDQTWFFTPGWLAGEREADENIAAGRGTVHKSVEEMFDHLNSLGSAREAGASRLVLGRTGYAIS